MPHSELEALIPGYVLSALDPQEQRPFEEHLATCDQCTRTVAEMAALVGLLPLLAEDREPPPHLRERILAAASAGQARTDAAPRARGPWRQVFTRTHALAATMAALLLAIAVLAGWGFHLQGSLDDRQAQLQSGLEQSERRLDRSYLALEIMAQAGQWWRFRGTGAAPNAAGSLAYSEEHATACLVVWGLPPAQERAYHAWAVKQGVPASVGNMWAMDSALWIFVPGDMDQLDRVEITLEEARDPATPGGPVVISVPLADR